MPNVGTDKITSQLFYFRFYLDYESLIILEKAWLKSLLLRFIFPLFVKFSLNCLNYEHQDYSTLAMIVMAFLIVLIEHWLTIMIVAIRNIVELRKGNYELIATTVKNKMRLCVVNCCSYALFFEGCLIELWLVAMNQESTITL